MAIDPILVDVYQKDFNGNPNWPAFLAYPHSIGAILKATEGLYYRPDWFAKQWRTVENAAGARYGVDFFRGAYHYLIFKNDGKAQADFYMAAINLAGGFCCDILPVVDVELGGDKSANRQASKQQIVDCVSNFSARIKETTGRKVILYGGNAMAEHGITDHMGCDWLWVARYAPALPAETYLRIGWKLDQVLLWQYAGVPDGCFLKDYPYDIPGFGEADLSVVLNGNQPATLESFKARAL